MKSAEPALEKLYFVTGTFHGAYVIATSEGEARRIFHTAYNGESILYIKPAYLS